MARLSIVVPVYYNEETISMLYNDLKEKVFSEINDYELVMVDDGSLDKSWEEMTKIVNKDSRVRIIKLSRNFGSHAAILAGINECTGDCAMIKAADLQEPSEIIIDMYKSWETGNKVVLAVREDRKESFGQKLFANMYYWLVRKFAIPNMPKTGFDCYLIDRKVMDVLRNLDEQNSALTLQILWSGFKTDMIYYVRQKRELGKSRWTLAKKVKLVMDSMLSFSYVPVRFVTGIGVSFSVVAFIWCIVVIVEKLIGGVPVQGWTSLMILMLFSSGLILFTLGILGEYLWRTLDASRKETSIYH